MSHPPPQDPSRPMRIIREVGTELSSEARETSAQRSQSSQHPYPGNGGVGPPNRYQPPPPGAHSQPPPIRLAPGQPPPFFLQDPLFQQLRQQLPRHRQYGSSDGRRGDRELSTSSANQFPLDPLDRFKVHCAPFRQPVEIGSFSYDEHRNFVMDDSQLKYYFPPDLRKPNNLSVNYDKYITRDPMIDEHIDALLDALICIRDREEEEEEQQRQEPPLGVETEIRYTRLSMTKADFVCYRGVLTKIMCTPYARHEAWELGATLYKGTIYIEEHSSDAKRKNALGANDRHKLMSYWGYRFETICNISKPVSELRRIKAKKRPRSLTPTHSPSTAAGGPDRPTEETLHVQGPDRKAQKLLENGRDGEDLSGRRMPPVNTDGQREGSVEGAATSPRSANSDNNNNNNNNSHGDGNNDDIEKEEQDLGQIDLDDPELTGRLDGIVNTNFQYCTVARTKIGQNSIIMGAEVDCTSEPKKPRPHNPLSNYVELKTSRIITSDRERNNFERHKLLKFWAQSFLPGIPTIIVGFRDDDGNVVKVETFKTMEIPRSVRGKEGAWDTTVCINFLDGILTLLRKIVIIDDPKVTYNIYWGPPFRAIEVIFAGSRNAFLTDRFLRRWNNSSSTTS